MPVNSTKDLIPFVNTLEGRVDTLTVDMNDWTTNKSKIMNALPKIDSNTIRSATALTKAEEALTEINTATFGIVAKRGQRLKTLIEDLKKKIVEIGENAGGGFGTGTLDENSTFAREINNAISGVDISVQDGMRLDYRLYEIQQLAAQGGTLGDKEWALPYSYTIDSDVNSTMLRVITEDDIEFLAGEVTVLDHNGSPIADENNQLITGTITEAGDVMLSNIPHKPIKLYFPINVAIKDIPQDFLYVFANMMIQKNGVFMQKIFDFDKAIQDISTDMEAMKGENWTVDFSIMRNHQDIIKEGITPKGLQVEVQDNIVHAKFSYNDHPNLSHFILEKWDEEKKAYVPYDGAEGVVAK
jgi:hypothetical protein